MAPSAKTGSGTRPPSARPPSIERDRDLAGLFVVFLRLGLTSFGGPIAHLGYFRTEFVERRRWLSESAYADLVALCQFLPGPASSQVGFAVGLMRGGWAGAALAWAGFTLPSALALVAFAYVALAFDNPAWTGAIAGLKLLAVAVVAQAVLGMAKGLCVTREHIVIALAAVGLLAIWQGPGGQIAAIAAGGTAGYWLRLGQERQEAAFDPIAGGPSERLGRRLLWVAGVLLVVLPVWAWFGLGGQTLALFEAFYRAGMLVFGGGHVVLPLLEGTMVAPGWVREAEFLTGYAAAQAVPGPLFSLAAYLGTVSEPAPNGPLGAAIALVGIFLPGLLLVAGALPFWQTLREVPPARAILSGVNAAVVGVLASAFYDPVFTTAVSDRADAALALAGYFALTLWKVPVWTLVLAAAFAGTIRGGMGI